MEVLIIIFICTVLVIALFCVAVVTREIIIESKDRKKVQQENVPSTQPVTERIVYQDVPVESEIKEETVEEPSEEEDGNVNFDAVSKTLDEKYYELSAIYRHYYDEIVREAAKVENYKRFKNNNYEEYKVGKNRIVRLKIKRGFVIAELLIPNLAFKEYISENKVGAKLSPTTFKVVDETTLTAVKDSIAIAVKVIEEEKALKKEKAKERRRLAKNK